MTKQYSTENGKIVANLYEAFIKEPGDDRILNPSHMNHPMSEKEIIRNWGLDNEKTYDWFVVVGVIMHKREARNESEERIGCGFDYEIFEIVRGGNVPEDFDYNKYSHAPVTLYKKVELPDDEVIEKICNLSYKWNKYMSQTFGDISTKETQLEYIKKHWND